MTAAGGGGGGGDPPVLFPAAVPICGGADARRSIADPNPVGGVCGSTAAAPPPPLAGAALVVLRLRGGVALVNSYCPMSRLTADGVVLADPLPLPLRDGVTATPASPTAADAVGPAAARWPTVPMAAAADLSVCSGLALCVCSGGSGRVPAVLPSCDIQLANSDAVRCDRPGGVAAAGGGVGRTAAAQQQHSGGFSRTDSQHTHTTQRTTSSSTQQAAAEPHATRGRGAMLIQRRPLQQTKKEKGKKRMDLRSVQPSMTQSWRMRQTCQYVERG